MIEWPDFLPAPQLGRNDRAVSPFARTNMESGRARSRRIFTNVPVRTTMTFVLTPSQAQFFEGWFRNELRDGVEPFSIRTLTPYGRILQDVQCRDMYEGPDFVGMNRWRYKLDVEISERNAMRGDWWQFPDYVMGASIIDLEMNREWPEA